MGSDVGIFWHGLQCGSGDGMGRGYGSVVGRGELGCGEVGCGSGCWWLLLRQWWMCCCVVVDGDEREKIIYYFNV